MHFLKKYIREPISGLTHGFGVLLSVVGLFLLLYDAVLIDSTRHIIAFSMFGVSMILLYLSSTLYHSLHVGEKAIRLLKKLDHSMIYVLIAGSYTPICLIVLDESWKWIVFGAVWTFAIGGIIKKIFWIDAPQWLSLFLYLGMGWMGIFLFPTLFEKLPLAFLIWILAGGLAYTIGAVIYGVKKPDPLPGLFGHHEIWHLFVMGGTFSHFWAFYWYLPGFAG
ncbi:hemolysin III family protein [Aliifodinibius sp. S!AR15-10]|uniref:PAQR family membrane homeostasis protein TrhA n=1 Tax=Aliifodinibius sp. S!AR15-10 TaxID=2950437 RepID=UPI00285FBD73|nr:hemolysin III family protein [Aliifodinibius sp. S!AR15-10]MDR8391329.1 hemolysin III family protein [Aliifodinibius sp. S!AR15-10]